MHGSKGTLLTRTFGGSQLNGIGVAKNQRLLACQNIHFAWFNKNLIMCSPQCRPSYNPTISSTSLCMTAVVRQAVPVVSAALHLLWTRCCRHHRHRRRCRRYPQPARSSRALRGAARHFLLHCLPRQVLSTATAATAKAAGSGIRRRVAATAASGGCLRQEAAAALGGAAAVGVVVRVGVTGRC